MLAEELNDILQQLELQKLSEDGGTVIEVPLPADPGDQPAVVRIALKLDLDNEAFVLAMPIGALAGNAKPNTFRALFEETFWMDRTRGTCVVLNPETSILLAVQHWVLPTITREQFETLLEQFFLGGTRLMEVAHTLSTIDKAIRPVLAD